MGRYVDTDGAGFVRHVGGRRRFVPPPGAVPIQATTGGGDAFGFRLHGFASCWEVEGRAVDRRPAWWASGGDKIANGALHANPFAGRFVGEDAQLVAVGADVETADPLGDGDLESRVQVL